MLDEVINKAKDGMEKGLTALKVNLSKLRTGRASLVILDGIKVDYYGTMSPLNQVATLAVPEPRMITIQPWEATMIKPIEKAIEKANIGLNPTSDGKIVRLPIPQLTEERRKEIAKQIKNMSEESRVAVRQARKEANDALKKHEKDSKISEDDLKRGTEQIQKATDDYIKKIDQMAVAKEKDIMTV
ncbi:MAG: ribosome recycling factor [Deltaproteobacteria bacterium]|nr:ribosome recycling factor [Deltaproteobacteria bacterium]